MTSTVSCPDCGRPAEVTSRFTLGGTDGTEYLRIRCRGALALLVPATEVRTPQTDPGPTRPGPLLGVPHHPTPRVDRSDTQ